MVLKLENPELFMQPRKIFPVPTESGMFYISLQVKELQGYLKLKIPLGFNLLIFPFCRFPAFHGICLSEQ